MQRVRTTMDITILTLLIIFQTASTPVIKDNKQNQTFPSYSKQRNSVKFNNNQSTLIVI